MLKRWMTVGLVAMVMICCGFTAMRGTPELVPGVLRLHIRANSDSVEDQRIKLQVRDRLTSEFSHLLAQVQDADQAEAVLQAQLPQIEQTAQETLRAAGFDYGAHAEIAVQTFPERRYGEIIYPAGDYRALTLYLGTGGGHNWWCVMFPPLCFVDAQQQEENQTLELTEQAPPVTLKSHIADWLREWKWPGYTES
ncbi:stage II sporulation protein R [Christensenellaceae bacterium NSJ-44]|uniref:Stage II sporulation protein R n=1 Tax=Luoshenia tenuis TaxID=2763654 RepID=A0A926HID8_9FIRM|nr:MULTISPECIES: stage II sporulation protein R [Clostridia]MBC8528677.1 stage II sporulation protein R [Luoshenia tenuis]